MVHGRAKRRARSLVEPNVDDALRLRRTRLCREVYEHRDVLLVEPLHQQLLDDRRLPRAYYSYGSM